MEFNKLADVQGLETAINTIRTSEATIRDTLNDWGVQVLNAVYAGDNIAHLNNLIGAFNGVRQTRLVKVMRGFCAHKFNGETGKFEGKEKNAAVIKKRESAYVEFLASDETLYGLLETLKKGDKKEPDYVKALQKAAANALEHGIDAETVMTVIRAAVAQEAVNKLAAVPAAPAEENVVEGERENIANAA